MKIVCKSCDGKGHVLDKSAMIFVPVVSWIIALIEKDQEDSLTRDTCSNCNGKGYVILH
jgi:DnaJ-class molecular chaperone